MPRWLSEREERLVKGAEELNPRYPVPTQIVSNGEYLPPSQSPKQKMVEGRVAELADRNSDSLGLTRRQYLLTNCGLAAAFLAMNEVYGAEIFQVDANEAGDPDLTKDRADRLAGQFIFDAQTHFVRDDFPYKEITRLGNYSAQHWNPSSKQDSVRLEDYKFENYVHELWFNSDTKMALLSGAPFDDPEWYLLSNDQIMDACSRVNDLSGSVRLRGHAVITPGQPGWLDTVDEVIGHGNPNLVSWKTYTIGDPSGPSKWPWRLDDEKLMYPFYEKSLAAGINTICIHKGLMPPDYEQSFRGLWRYATAWDIEKAARDWPDMNFIFYHSALRPFLELPDQAWLEFERTGRIRWVTDLCEAARAAGTGNVYGELGTSFANSAIAHPKFCAAFIGTLVAGLGTDHVLWGTDSVWYGSPQWQIEAMRRLEVPEDMRVKYSLPELGGANSGTKQAIFGLNAARIYDIDVTTAQKDFQVDKMSELVRNYREFGDGPTNRRYGLVRRA